MSEMDALAKQLREATLRAEAAEGRAEVAEAAAKDAKEAASRNSGVVEAAAGQEGFPAAAAAAPQGRSDVVVMGNRMRPPPFDKNNPRIFMSKFLSHLTSLGLRHTIDPDYGRVEVINRHRRSVLVGQFGDKLVGECETAWQCLMESCSKTDFEEKLHAAGSVTAAWQVVRDWSLPTSTAEISHLKKKLVSLEMRVGEDPKMFFARFDRELNTLAAVGVGYDDEEVVHILRNNLSAEYDVEKRTILLGVSRPMLEKLVSDSYATRLDSGLGTSTVVDPHALAMQSGGYGGPKRGGFGATGRAQQQQPTRGVQQQQQQPMLGGHAQPPHQQQRQQGSRRWRWCR